MSLPSELFERLPAPVAEAVVERGFTSLTPIQQRLLDPELEAVDLRIASQTGSGKTVALGFVLAPALAHLAELKQGRGRGAAQPFALLIAPTRELAAQLSRELGWLYRKLGARVTVVAGGASYREEKQELSLRPLVIVGTPGRLKDHLERGSIDASLVGCVVLDEADQMLDLGFREELEAILGMLPAERRTHLMSATFPREVQALAKRYQRDSVLVEGTDLGVANSDITHVAHLVHPNEREAALINLLLMAPGERTLMFVRTRADAAELASRLTRAGFYSLALSGDLEQRERNKTLEAFRSGGVTTLVATDVAARGLDIQDVGRVIHVDPPTDSEMLTHRSGRTGRAGRKGVSIVLVAPSARMRVQELLRRARIEATWRPVPGPKDVRRAMDDRLCRELKLDSESSDRFGAVADRLLSELEPHALVCALLARSRHGGPCEPRPITPIAAPERQRTSATRARKPEREQNRPRRAKRAPEESFVRFRINWGEAEGADKGRLLNLVCRRGGVKGAQIGAIRIGPDESTVDVASAYAGKFTKRVSRADSDDPTISIQMIHPTRERRRA
jgi:ATP-dependent RNA helicase DeaD